MTPEEVLDLETWRQAIARRIDKLEEALAGNTEATQRVDRNTSELVEIMQSWKGAMRVLEWLGKLAKPLAAIGAALSAWFVWRGTK